MGSLPPNYKYSRYTMVKYETGPYLLLRRGGGGFSCRGGVREPGSCCPGFTHTTHGKTMCSRVPDVWLLFPSSRSPVLFEAVQGLDMSLLCLGLVPTKLCVHAPGMTVHESKT